MSGFAPPPSDGVTPLLVRRSRESQFEYVLQRIASGEEKNPSLAAKVALGELPIGALLTDSSCNECGGAHEHRRCPLFVYTEADLKRLTDEVVALRAELAAK